MMIIMMMMIQIDDDCDGGSGDIVMDVVRGQ